MTKKHHQSVALIALKNIIIIESFMESIASDLKAGKITIVSNSDSYMKATCTY